MSDYGDSRMTPSEGSHIEPTGPTLQGLQSQVNNLSAQLQQVVALLQQTLQHTMAPAPPAAPPPGPPPAPDPPSAPAPAPAPAPVSAPTASDFSSLTVKELAKQSLNLAEKQRLSGPENYQQWYQAISIQFRALQIPEFLEDPDLVSGRLSDPQKAALLLTLRNTLKDGPMATIAFETDPAVAYKRLRLQYAPAQPVLRDELYREFHSLRFDGSTTVVDFNAKFNTIVSRLRGLGVEIAEIDQINHYFNVLESHFSQWAERCKGLLRQEQWLYNTEGKTTRLSLLYFQEDLLAETRNSTSSTAQQLSALHAHYKRSYRGQQQAQGANDSTKRRHKEPRELKEPQRPKRSKESERERGRKLGSAKGSTKEEAFSTTEPSKAAENTAEEPSNEAFTIGYNLETGTLFSSTTAEESEPEELPESLDYSHSTRHNNAQWLFDTGSTVHICNDKTLFTGLTRPTTLGVVRTGGGLVRPQGIGTVKIEFLTGYKENTALYSSISLTDTLYIPGFPLNIVSGHRLYTSGGTLIKEKIYTASRKVVGLLNFQRSGFFFTTKSAKSTTIRPQPQAYGTIWHCYSSEKDSDTQGCVPYNAPRVPYTPTEGVTDPERVPSNVLEGVTGSSTATEPTELTSATTATEPTTTRPAVTEPTATVPTTALKAPSAALIQAARLWHVRLGHIGLDLLKKTALVTKGMPNLQKVRPTDLACKSCDAAKILRRPSKRPVSDPPYALGRIEGDIFIIRPTPLNNRPYGLVLVDRKTRFRMLRLLKSKDEAVTEAKSAIESLYNTYKRYPAHFHYDGGKEIRRLLPYLTEKGIGFSESSPYAHNQNGLAERSIRVIIERLRATIIASGLPPSLWGYVIGPVVELINRTANSTTDLTPYQLFLDELVPSQAPHTPDLQNYRAIGTECTVLIPPEKRVTAEKLVPKGTKGKLLAVLGHQTYLVWLGQRRVVQTSFIKLYEDTTAHLQGPIGPTNILQLPDVEDSEEPSETRVETVEPPPEPPPTAPRLPPATGLLPTTVEIPLPQATKAQREEYEVVDDDGAMDTSDLVCYLATKATEVCHAAKKAKATKNSEPTTFKQALKHPQQKEWLEASFKELQQLLATKTFYFVGRSEAQKPPITSRWVYKAKKNTAGQVTKYKARLVVRGFQQVPGIDFTETYAATATPPTWRVILAIAAIEDLEVEQIDFIGAFLNAGVDVDVYIEPPEGLHEFSLSSTTAMALLKQHGWDPTKDQVILLKRSLYGLKQAPHLWQQKVATLLKSLGYLPLASDIATYYNSEDKIFIISHVDDCLLIGPAIRKINALKLQLAKAYDIEDLGPAQFFLGVQIERNRPKRLLWIYQKAYITEAIQHFGLSTNGPKIPLSPGLTGPDSPTQALNSTEKRLYQQLIGTAMYAMTQTRPDIAFSVQWLSRQLQQPTTAHLKAAKKLLSYLYGTKELAIQYCDTASTAPEGYTDSDFAGCKITARSTYGYLFTVGKGPVSWKSKRASTVSYSTLEAEFTGLIEGNREALWLRGLYHELQRPIQGPTPLKGDNQGAIDTAYNPKHHSRTKHTLLKYQGIRESVTEGNITISYMPTEEMPADGLTKALTAAKHEHFLALLNLSKPY